MSSFEPAWLVPSPTITTVVIPYEDACLISEGLVANKVPHVVLDNDVYTPLPTTAVNWPHDSLTKTLQSPFTEQSIIEAVNAHYNPNDDTPFWSEARYWDDRRKQQSNADM